MIGALTIFGCRPSDSWRVIDARIEINEIADVDVEGTITLTFDRAMKLSEPASSGIQFTHPAVADGHYRIEQGERRNEWKVLLVSGFTPLLPRGESSDGTGTRLLLNLDQFSSSPELSQYQKRVSDSILITPCPIEPARLTGARWIDTDGSSTVNQEDLLILDWDRKVSTGIDRHHPGDTFAGPDDLIRLPVSGDRLGNNDFPPHWIASDSSMHSSLILGASPMLTIDGIADPSRFKF